MVFGISTALFSGLVGAIIGGSFTLAAQLLSNWDRRRKERQRLRQAFISEIISMRVGVLLENFLTELEDPNEIMPEGLIDEYSELQDLDIEYAREGKLDYMWRNLIENVQEDPDFTISGPQGLFIVREGTETMFPTRVFENNLDEIGRLESEEIDHIVSLYTAVEVLRKFLDAEYVEEILFAESDVLEIDNGDLPDQDTQNQFRTILLLNLLLVYSIKQKTLEVLRNEGKSQLLWD